MTRQRIVVVTISVLFSSLVAEAQTYIFGRADFPVGNSPVSMVSGDFNGDGITDLAVVNQGDNTVSVLLGRPDGTFAPQFTYATGLGPTAIATGDFNGDGNLDLAVTNADCMIVEGGGYICYVQTVSILLGNGDGTFQPKFDYPTGDAPYAVVAADLNGDNKLDLVIANARDNTISVLLGNGDGTFQNQVVYQTNGVIGADSLIVADFNGDHKLDLAVGGGLSPQSWLPGSGVSVLLGNGDGTFQTAISASGSGPLAAADFNLDGKLDLFAGGSVLLGNGDGTFVLYATYPGGSAAGAVDLNGDGKPDLVVTQALINNNSYAPIAVFLGNGDGTFQPAVQYGSVSPASLIIADFNGDGKFDLAVAGCAGCSPGAVSIVLGFGDGTFVGPKAYPLQSDYPATEVISADFNGDGKPDLAAETVLSNAALGVLLGNSDGTFQSAVITSLSQAPGGIAAADFNGDGKADLATVFSNCSNNICLPGDAVVLIGNGNGTFESPVEYEVGLQPQFLAAGDFNDDGKPDLAVTNSGSGTISILLNTGTGSFQSHVDYPAGSNPGPIVIGDFNGDGHLDLATTTGVLLGNGNGTFQKVIALPAPGYVYLVTGDFNQDGKLDLAVVGDSGNLTVLLGNGDGTFQTGASYPFGGIPSVGDVNGDGKLDLIVGDFYDPAGTILLGNGDGTFQPAIPNFPMSLLIAVADFNQDGVPDAAGSTGSLNGDPDMGVSVMLSTAFRAVSPGSLNFGSQGVATTSTSKAITISNPSNVNFDIASIVASGNFSQTNDCGASLVLGAHCSVTVTFVPTTTGPASGTITVTDSTKISPLAIALSGTGVTGPFMSLNPGRTNFAPQTVGTTGSPSAILLVNTGTSLLNITGISITGANSSDFTQNNNCGSSLAPAGSCSVNVTFAPSAGGSREASVAVSDTAPGSPQLASLEGTGLGPLSSLNPTQLSFASETIGTTSTAQIITLANVGNTALTIANIAASGDFGETNTCTSVGAGGSCQVSVTFTPTATGNRTGTITIADNAPGSPQIISVSGVGAPAPDFSVGPASGSSTSQTIGAGQTASFSLALTGTGSFTGTVNLSCAMTPVVTPAPTCSLSSSSVQITGNGTQTVKVNVGTSGPVTSGAAPHATFPAGPFPLAWTLIFVGWAWIWVRNRKRLPVIAAPIVVLAFAFVAGCGAGGSSSSTHTTPGTPAGTYTATISAASGNTIHHIPLQVVVQ